MACEGKERGENEGRRGERVPDGGEEVRVERQREESITIIAAGLRQGRSQKYPQPRQLGTMSLQREEQDDSRQSRCQSPMDRGGGRSRGLEEATVMSQALILPVVRYEADRRLLLPPLQPEQL